MRAVTDRHRSGMEDRRAPSCRRRRRRWSDGGDGGRARRDGMGCDDRARALRRHRRQRSPSVSTLKNFSRFHTVSSPAHFFLIRSGLCCHRIYKSHFTHRQVRRSFLPRRKETGFDSFLQAEGKVPHVLRILFSPLRKRCSSLTPRLLLDAAAHSFVAHRARARRRFAVCLSRREHRPLPLSPRGARLVRRREYSARAQPRPGRWKSAPEIRALRCRVFRDLTSRRFVVSLPRGDEAFPREGPHRVEQEAIIRWARTTTPCWAWGRTRTTTS